METPPGRRRVPVYWNKLILAIKFWVKSVPFSWGFLVRIKQNNTSIKYWWLYNHWWTNMKSKTKPKSCSMMSLSPLSSSRLSNNKDHIFGLEYEIAHSRALSHPCVSDHAHVPSFWITIITSSLQLTSIDYPTETFYSQFMWIFVSIFSEITLSRISSVHSELSSFISLHLSTSSLPPISYSLKYPKHPSLWKANASHT